jgi:hypothetical protein
MSNIGIMVIRVLTCEFYSSVEVIQQKFSVAAARIGMELKFITGS